SKATKQLGMRSFLTASKGAKGPRPAAAGGGRAASSNTSDRSSFVSAASLTIGDARRSEREPSSGRRGRAATRGAGRGGGRGAKGERPRGESEECGDDGTEEEKGGEVEGGGRDHEGAARRKRRQRLADDDRRRFSDGEDVAEVSREEAKAKASERRLRKLNRMEFGMRNCVFGKFPLTNVRKRRRAVEEADASPEDSAEGADDADLRDRPRPRETPRESRLFRGASGVPVLSHLTRRSCLSSAAPRTTSALRRFADAGRHWNACETVELAADSAVGEACAMSFDRDGVLLATGDDRGRVRIYDFDDVRCLDATERNVRSRTSKKKRCANEDPGRGGWTTAGAAEEEAPSDGLEGGTARDAGESDADSGDEGVGSELPSAPPAVARPVRTFQCRVSRGGNIGPRVSCLEWSPRNQDHLLVSFANQHEVHMYDVASSQTPLPFLRLGDSQHSRSEGISKAMSLPSGSKCHAGLVLTGGTYGSVRLWAIAKPPKAKRRPTIGDHVAKCVWSVDAFDTKGEGVSDATVLPLESRRRDPPLVLLAGSACSLSVLDANKVTRKAFSTAVTPTVVASWDLHRLASQEFSKVDAQAQLPPRRWMAAHRLSLLGREDTDDASWFKVCIVAKCGWIYVVELRVPTAAPIETAQARIGLGFRIAHHTPRMQCFNSSNERLATLGGVALQFSLPDVPVPSCGHAGALRDMLWLGDVKPRRYTLPSKDKYVLFEDHGTAPSRALSTTSGSSTTRMLRHEGDGLVLANLKNAFEASSTDAGGDAGGSESICARLPLRHGTPLCLASHPSGEWIVVGYGMNGRGASTKPLQLVSLRKSFPDSVSLG
ncbi:hypothetical protein ACHAWF_004882, partial [Thalassiosira exigua]